MDAIVKTDFCFPGQKSVYKGKVRDVYDINDEYLVMVVSDRISAFDVILPEGVPYKGQVLNQIASKFLDATADIVPNWTRRNERKSKIRLSSDHSHDKSR